MDKDTLKCIHDLNLSALLLSQRMIKEDKTVAMYRLGISEEMADIIRNLNTSHILTLSETNQLIFQLRFRDHEMLQKIIEDSRVSDIKQMHTGILLSSLLLDSMNKE